MYFDNGAKIPQPSIAPNNMYDTVGRPIMIPWPIYAGEGWKSHKYCFDADVPKIGTFFKMGKKNDSIV